MIGLATKIGVGLVTASVATAVLVAVITPTQAAPEQATVVGHVDGDTFDVEVDGKPERIRLINIDTPETKDPQKPIQCLGPEASAFLANMIPIGAPVRLEFDKDREDRYGRTIAATFTSDGKMVNAEMARAGLAQVVTYDDNVRFRPPIEQAWQEAAANKRGLHSPDVQCTVPAQVKTVADAVAQAPTVATQPPNLNSINLYNAADVMGAARVAAAALLQTLDHNRADITWTALTPEEQTQLEDQARTANETASREENALRRAATSASSREAQAARAAAQADADRIAREQAAAQAAEEQRAAEQAQREADVASVRDPPQNQRTGNSGHPCLPGERDGDNDGYCGEGR